MGGIGHVLCNEAVARAPVSAIAPFDFTELIWALGSGLWALGFDRILLPGVLALIGEFAFTFAALIVTFISSRRKV